jgi:hypothetical protein
MERTESTVVSVAPDFENEKIREMAFFGWNLHGRQEIIGPLQERGTSDNLFKEIGVGMMEGATGKKTFVRDHYVKLHFVRSLSLPNLGRIQKLEAEFRGLPLPPSPGGLVGPVLFTLMPLPGTLVGLADPLGTHGPGFFILIVAVPWILLGISWIKKRKQKRAAVEAQHLASRKRASEIFQELPTLIDVAHV